MATQMVQQLTEQATSLVREELTAARTEIVDRGKRVGIGAGLIGAAGMIACYGLGALAVTVGALLALVWPAWLAVLVTTVYTVAVTALIAFAIHKTMGFRIAPEDEVGGIDLSEHRETAYDLEVALAYTGATDEAGELEKH